MLIFFLPLLQLYVFISNPCEGGGQGVLTKCMAVNEANHSLEGLAPWTDLDVNKNRCLYKYSLSRNAYTLPGQGSEG